MTDARIDGLRSIELGVHDLQKSAEFYRRVWALEDVAAEGDTIHLRGTGREHHVVTLRERPRASLLGCTSRLPTRPPSMRCMPRPRPWAPRSGGGRAARSERRRRLRLPGQHTGRPSDLDLVRRRGACGSDRRSLAADQAHPRRAQQRRGGEADRVFSGCAGVQVERFDLHDGLREMLLRPPQRGVRARQRADAQSHGLRDAEHRRTDARRRSREKERL